MPNEMHNTKSNNEEMTMHSSILSHTQAQKQDFCFSINQVCHNKTHHYDEPKTWNTNDGTVEDLANQIKKGKAFMVGLLPEDKKRNKENVVGFNAIAFDIDSDLTIEDALSLPIVKDYCGLIYTSHSHQKTKYIEPSKKYPNGREIEPCDRYRLVFILPNLIDDVDLYDYLWLLMFNKHFPMADKSCKDASRIYFGNDETEIIECDPSKVLPESILEDARFKRELDNAEKQDKAIKKPNYDYDPQETEKLVYEALDYIPPRAYGTGNYNECLRVLMALENEFGKDKAIDIAEKWSPSQPPSKDGKKWNVPNKINSFKRSEIKIGTLFLIAEQHGFKMSKKTAKTKPSGKSINVNTLKKDDVISLIDEVINSNYSGSKLTVELEELARETGWKKHELEKLYNQRLEEIELEETKEDRKKELEELLKVGTKSVKLSDVFDDNLAKGLSHKARIMGVNEEAFITSILPILASLIPIGNNLLLVDELNFVVKPIIWNCLIAPSASGKSPLQKTFIEPLYEIQEQLDQEYKQRLEQWEQDCLDAKKDDKPKPKKPRSYKAFTTDTTIEGLSATQANQPDQGILIYRDELAGFFKGMNKYSNGDDTEIWLSIRDGSPINIVRADQDKEVWIKNPQLPLLGTIQPKVLNDLANKMGGFGDSNGMLARIIFDQMKKDYVPLKKGGQKVDCYPTLLSLYQRLKNLNVSQYKLSQKASDYYIDWYNHLGQIIYSESDDGYRNVLGKMQGNTGIIALILHLSNACLKDELPNEEINLETMEAAVKLSSYYIDQYRKFRLDHEEQQKSDENALPPLLKAIVDVASKKQDWITPKDVINDYRSKFKGKKAPDVIKLFNELVNLGYGETKKTSRTTKFRIHNGDNLDNLDNQNGSNPDIEKVVSDNDATTKTTTETTTSTTLTNNHVEETKKVVDDNQSDNQNDNRLKTSDNQGSSHSGCQVVEVVEPKDKNDDATTEDNDYINQDRIMDHGFSFEAANDLISKIHDGTLKQNINVWTYGNQRYDVTLTDDGIITNIQKDDLDI